MRLFSLCRSARFETLILPSIRFYISLQNFKKPLDIFSPQIERKRSKEYLVIILPVKESLERFSCLEFVFEKSKHREAGLEHKHKLKAWRLRIFRDTLIVVFVNENCCLCICFTKLYFFYWLLVVSLAILIAVPFVFSHSVNIACRSTQNAARMKRFWRLQIVYKTINKKINTVNSLLC